MWHHARHQGGPASNTAGARGLPPMQAAATSSRYDCRPMPPAGSLSSRSRPPLTSSQASPWCSRCGGRAVGWARDGGFGGAAVRPSAAQQLRAVRRPQSRPAPVEAQPTRAAGRGRRPAGGSLLLTAAPGSGGCAQSAARSGTRGQRRHPTPAPPARPACGATAGMAGALRKPVGAAATREGSTAAAAGCHSQRTWV